MEIHNHTDLQDHCLNFGHNMKFCATMTVIKSIVLVQRKLLNDLCVCVCMYVCIYVCMMKIFVFWR